MFSFALLPIGIYFAIFTFIFCKRRPTFLSGSSDIGILLLGIFGLVSFGPGKILIPLYVYRTWGAWSILFWMMIYYLAAYCICNSRSNCAIIYNCNFMQLVECITTLSKRLDMRFYIEDRTIHLPTLGLHCVIDGSFCEKEDKVQMKIRQIIQKDPASNVIVYSGSDHSNYVSLKLSGTRLNNPAWELFQRELSEACSNLKSERRTLSFLYGILAGAILFYSLSSIPTDFQTLQTIFSDYWS
ncbi:MAG: hypothetical protein LBB88_07220 [Planctomycetaceae bacterium]|nr:hypothetical protein [Planctomycetaceae bacterium]